MVIQCSTEAYSEDPTGADFLGPYPILSGLLITDGK